jgi:DNA-binding transcriptional ArsR family regulator
MKTSLISYNDASCNSHSEFHKEYCLKDLSVLLQKRHYNMHLTIASILPISFPFSVSSIICSFGNDSSHSNFNESRRFKLILWSIIGATRGGPNRARILNLLIIDSLNSHQIAKKLNLDHKTVRHHLKILTKNELIVKSSESYGATYTLTGIMKQNVELLKEIVTKMRGN